MDNARLVFTSLFEIVINFDFGNCFLCTGLFCQLSRENSRSRDLPQNLWKKWWLWVVVMGANTFNVCALFQLHRIWISRRRNLSRMHKRPESVSIMLPYLMFFLMKAFHHSCPARECHSPHKCKGKIVYSKIVEGGHIEDCISICVNNSLCEYYTLEKKADFCVLYEDCLKSTYCDTCATGRQYCSRGYHGMLKMACLDKLYFS